ncbi:haloacid dehalogenase-like hydrolase domain-containing 5 [Lingula anatina]|uniref:Haloacid dehalogenase-like hydrolase domain-containing 5 n=1 Tax=Lingula anatina TaxID=7574 RepID=A0A1S3JZG1_LINAN|nr:haloacid dehalogenase-like hydrolase domain-containing 5 [Lingula anatina]|eukprot:XP_013415667.1 haloacid dehalogenase-like hydrolase domain-containing 5 [Lingula anatina]
MGLKTCDNHNCFTKKKLPAPENIDFGLMFDVDGVIARGSAILEAAKKMMKLLYDANGHMIVPTTFVTNSCSPRADKAKSLSEGLGVKVVPEQIINAQAPLSMFKEWHDKHILFLGQGPLREQAKELGFTNVCTMDDVCEAYPLLDVVNHENRKRIAREHPSGKTFPRVEAMVIIGEPDRWDCHLQLLIDLLITDGMPTQPPKAFPEHNLPILACNMDLVFMAEACMPRYGNGAFLICLEALYKKITGSELEYTALIGKPSEITYRHAEHVLATLAKGLGIKKPLRKLYMFGDNPEVDIVGASLYDKYIKCTHRLSDTSSSSSSSESSDEESDHSNNNHHHHHHHDLLAQGSIEEEAIPVKSRRIPKGVEFSEQTADACEGILVGTGVYNPTTTDLRDTTKPSYGHRDIESDVTLKLPGQFSPDVYEGVKFVFEKEGVAIPTDITG